MSGESSHDSVVRIALKLKLSPRFLTAAACIGLLVGACAWLLKNSVKYVSLLLTGGLNATGPDWALLVIPLAGILLTGIYTRYILRHDISHGVERLSNRLHLRRYEMPFRLTYSPLLASTFTLGFGGSAGSEGPIAYAGSAVGSNLGHRMGFRDRDLMLLTVMGAGAGIAGIFKAPLGGALFVIEVLHVSMSASSALTLTGCCLLSAFTARMLSGDTPDMVFIPASGIGLELYPVLIVLGMACGAYSMWYTYSATHTRSMLERIGNPWWRNILSGAVLSMCVFMFPMLYGEGYTSMSHIVNGNATAIVSHSMFADMGTGSTLLLILAAGILLVKGIAAYATNSGGGVAGDFAPTLFAGCVAGFLFAGLWSVLTGTDIGSGNMAFLAMAGVMAGVIHAPFMATFITVEMTGAANMLFPTAVVAFTSYGLILLVRRLRK